MVVILLLLMQYIFGVFLQSQHQGTLLYILGTKQLNKFLMNYLYELVDFPHTSIKI